MNKGLVSLIVVMAALFVALAVSSGGVYAGATQLTVIKLVVNDNGGTANADDFTMNVTATNPSSASFAGDVGGTTITLDAGTYSVGETGPAGYAASPSSDCSGTIAPGDHKTCTITNDDIAPQLTVIKNVVNNNGGVAVAADFTISVTGDNVSSTPFSGAESPGVTITLDAGTYSVAETGPAGYAASQSADCTGTIAVGESKICTITNFDLPAEAIAALQNDIIILQSNIAGIMGPKGIRTALTVKLDGAIAALDRGNNDLAISKLNLFINFVNVLESKKLTIGQAAALIAAANKIICAIDPTQPNCS